MLSDNLWQRNVDLAQACLAHPFVRGLADRTLDRGAFKCYIAQDEFFLWAFLRAYALAAAKCEQVDQVRSFHRLMGGILDELKLHASYAAEWGVDLSNVQALAATKAYTDFLLRTAWHHGVDESTAAMAPCMRLYAFLGTELAEYQRSDHPYADWIKTYCGEEFQALAAELESILDSVADDTPRVRDAYRYAVQCELDFFSAPLEKSE